jgi:CheY-like chemotaxis protein
MSTREDHREYPIEQRGERSPLRVLLVEDNVANQKIAVLLVALLGHRADTAANGAEALEALRRRPYDVVLMDAQMPVMDGFEAARRIAAEWPEGRRPWVIAMTANAMQGEGELCVRAGMDDYVSKPLERDELGAAFARAEAACRGRRDVPPAEEGVLDGAVMADLRACDDDGGGFVDQVIGIFLSGAPQRIAEMREALASGDLDTLRHAAHSLKGGSGTLGARRMASKCQAVEYMARERRLEGAEAAVADIERELELVTRALAAEQVA